jgi:hypothetical protein
MAHSSPSTGEGRRRASPFFSSPSSVAEIMGSTLNIQKSKTRQFPRQPGWNEQKRAEEMGRGQEQGLWYAQNRRIASNLGNVRGYRCPARCHPHRWRAALQAMSGWEHPIQGHVWGRSRGLSPVCRHSVQVKVPSAGPRISFASAAANCRLTTA